MRNSQIELLFIEGNYIDIYTVQGQGGRTISGAWTLLCCRNQFQNSLTNVRNLLTKEQNNCPDDNFQDGATATKYYWRKEEVGWVGGWMVWSWVGVG